MNFFIILIVSIIVFIPTRLIFIFANWIYAKVFKKENNMTFDIVISTVFLAAYMESLYGAMLGVAKNNEISDIEGYLIAVFFGIASILWCYFSWDLRLKAKPKFGVNDKQIAIKKVIIFVIIMVFSFANGYNTVYKEVYGQEILEGVNIINATIIIGIIAFDRVLNQVANCIKMDKQKKH